MLVRRLLAPIALPCLLTLSFSHAAHAQHLPKNGVDPTKRVEFAPRQKAAPTTTEALTSGYVSDKDKLRQLDSAMYPQIEEAQRTLKEVQRRRMKGLPKTDELYVTTRLYAPDGTFEHILLRVDKWVPNRIFGTIASAMTVTDRYKPGEQLSFEPKIVVDWKLKHADGTEEGNYVTDFLNQYYAEQTGKK